MTPPGPAAASLHVLLVEDDAGMAALVRTMLEEAWPQGLVLDRREDIAGAHRRLAQGGVDCVLLDLGLPDAEGLGAVDAVHAAAPEVPIVVLTGHDDDHLGLSAFRRGAEDYLVKGQVDGPGLVRAIRHARERKRALLHELAHLALHDALTGLPNRVLLHDRLAVALARARRSGACTAVVYFDLDGFKGVNDRLGHDAGDAVLREVARRGADALRGSDTIARLVGDEFVAVFEDVVPAGGAQIVVDRVSAVVREPIEVAGEQVVVDVSAGVAQDIGGEGDPAALVRAADAAMLRAKATRRGGPEPAPVRRAELRVGPLVVGWQRRLA
jgi:diguanylate cyclase (GGDEF)-like protein